MKDIYYLDKDNFLLEKFKNGLETRDLLPGRRPLLNNIDQYFSTLEKAGYKNLSDILNRLKSKVKIEKESYSTGIPIDYLTLLKREAGSYLPSIVALEKLTEPEHSNYLKGLAELGIKNSKQLFEAAYKLNDRKELAAQSEVPLEILNKWVQLCDLLRVNGVGPVFAHMLYDAGINSCFAFITIPAKELLEMADVVNKEKGYTKVTLRPEDIDYCMDYIKELELVLELD